MTSSWATRESLENGIFDVGASNNVGHLINGFRNSAHLITPPPTHIIKSDSLMHSQVANTFPGARRIAGGRHGAVYEINANMTYCQSLVSNNGEAYVDGVAPPMHRSIDFLLKVTRMTDRVPWSTWLRYRVREAKMHAAIHHKLQNGFASCMFVPAVYFAGVHSSSGMYFTFIQRPSGTLTSITNLIKHGKFTMDIYRSLEAAVGGVWNTGAMICDASAGNILVSSRGVASIVDFDSSIVYPTEIRVRLHNEMRALGRRLGRCLRVQNSSAPEFVRVWDLVMKPNNDEAVLKRLAIDVYGRRSWLPDVTMLRLLFNIASTTKGGGVTVASSSKSRLRLFAPIKKFFSPLRKDESFQFPSLRIRRVGALSKEERSEWRPRQHGHSERRSSTSRRNIINVANNNNTNNNNNSVTAKRVAVAAAAGTIPMPNSMVQGINPNTLKLVNSNAGSHVMRQGINNNTNTPNAPNRKNNAVATPVKTSPTNKEYRGYTTNAVNATRKKDILQHDVNAFKTTALYSTLIEELKTTKVKALNGLLNAKFKGVGWRPNETAAKRFRLAEVDDIATEKIVAPAIESVLRLQIVDASARRSKYKEAVNQRMSQLGLGVIGQVKQYFGY